MSDKLRPVSYSIAWHQEQSHLPNVSPILAMRVGGVTFVLINVLSFDNCCPIIIFYFF
jgi:hypothetical protein